MMMMISDHLTLELISLFGLRATPQYLKTFQ